jgi:ribose transport system substrate-binding protein
MAGSATPPLQPQPDSALPRTNSSPLRFVMVPKVGHPWFEQVRQGAVAGAAMLSSQTGRRVSIEEMAPAQATIALQQQMLSRAIASRPAGIFIDLLDPAALNPLLSEARAAGIGLVVFDSASPEGLAITAVGNDDCRQASIGSERLVALLGGLGEVAIMQGVPTAPNHATRFRCHQEVFRRYPGITVVATPSDLDDIARAEREAVATMRAHPNLRGWVASDASGPIGIGRAIASLGAKGRVKAVGIDDLPELVEQVRAGVVDSSVATRPRAQGYWAVLALWQQSLGAPTIERIDTGITQVK